MKIVLFIMFSFFSVGTSQDELGVLLQNLYGHLTPAPPPIHSNRVVLAPQGSYVWGEWGPFEECSVTCGRGIRRRLRSCFLYQQQGQPGQQGSSSSSSSSSSLQSLLPLMMMMNGGLLSTRQGVVYGCPGESIGSRSCFRISCPTSAPLRPTTRARLPMTISSTKRTISATSPLTIPICLTNWGPWGLCSATCGTSAIRLRIRQCNCKNPVTGESTCTGDLTDTEICQGLPTCTTTPPLTTTTVPTTTSTVATTTKPVMTTTPLPPDWSRWGTWSACPDSCGIRFFSTRLRVCKGDGVCPGQSYENRYCPFTACPTAPTTMPTTTTAITTTIVTNPTEQTNTTGPTITATSTTATVPQPPPQVSAKWSNWGIWSPCPDSCGFRFFSVRLRECGGNGVCPGQSREVRTCPFISCPTEPVAIWSNWGSWGRCGSTCGASLKVRIRTCSAENLCSGKNYENMICNNPPCANISVDWNSWGIYTPCDVTCGTGRQIRYRTCPKASACSGRDFEAVQCNKEPCSQ